MRRSEPEGVRRGRIIRQLAEAVEVFSRAGRFEEASHATEVLADAVEEHGQDGLAEVLRETAPAGRLASDFWSIHVVPDALRRARHLADELVEKGVVEVLHADRHGWGFAPSHAETPFHPVLTHAGYRYFGSKQIRMFPTGHGLMPGPSSWLDLRHRYGIGKPDPHASSSWSATTRDGHEIAVTNAHWDSFTTRVRRGGAVRRAGGVDAQSLARYLAGRARRRPR